MEILVRIGHGDDVPPLVAMLARGRSSLSWAAAQALAATPAIAARDASLAALAAPQQEVVAAAVVALGQRRDEVARPTLEELLDHPSAGVRLAPCRRLLLRVRTSTAAHKRGAVEPIAEFRPPSTRHYGDDD